VEVEKDEVVVVEEEEEEEEEEEDSSIICRALLIGRDKFFETVISAVVFSAEITPGSTAI
jgi:hypothetical protein